LHSVEGQLNTQRFSENFAASPAGVSANSDKSYRKIYGQDMQVACDNY
jgi:hypothetical protein